MKICTLCKTEKPLDQYNRRKSSDDGLQNVCKECNRDSSRRYYRENTDKHKRVIKGRKKKSIRRSQEYVWNWLKEHSCVDCGENDIVVLEFDHLRDKDKAISEAVARGWCIVRIQKEIDKCEVRCANCHRRKTAKDGKWSIVEWTPNGL